MIGRRALAALALASATPLAAQPLHAPAAAVTAEPLGEVADLQARDTRLFAAGWRLVTGNAPFCDSAAPAIGMLLHDAAAYSEPAQVRSELRLSGDIGVQAVAPGSPAALAGIAANDTLLSLGGQVLDEAFPRSDPEWQRLVNIKDRLDSALTEEPVALEWARPDAAAAQASIAGIPACASRFEVLASGARAVADGSRVLFGRDFPGFAYPEDEFAAGVAHELAHNLLRHRALLEPLGRPRDLVRLTERDADRLMPWLLANAGYDPHAAARFMSRWGPRHGGGLLRKRTHDGWDERVEFIETEIAAVERLMAKEGMADWSRQFTRLATEAGAD
ncbi:PDZ domain-containing protein [Qipengyuania sp. SM2507]